MSRPYNYDIHLQTIDELQQVWRQWKSDQKMISPELMGALEPLDRYDFRILHEKFKDELEVVLYRYVRAKDEYVEHARYNKKYYENFAENKARELKSTQEELDRRVAARDAAIQAVTNAREAIRLLALEQPKALDFDAQFDQRMAAYDSVQQAVIHAPTPIHIQSLSRQLDEVKTQIAKNAEKLSKADRLVPIATQISQELEVRKAAILEKSIAFAREANCFIESDQVLDAGRYIQEKMQKTTEGAARRIQNLWSRTSQGPSSEEDLGRTYWHSDKLNFETHVKSMESFFYTTLTEVATNKSHTLTENERTLLARIEANRQRVAIEKAARQQQPAASNWSPRAVAAPAAAAAESKQEAAASSLALSQGSPQ